MGQFGENKLVVVFIVVLFIESVCKAGTGTGVEIISTDDCVILEFDNENVKYPKCVVLRSTEYEYEYTEGYCSPKQNREILIYIMHSQRIPVNVICSAKFPIVLLSPLDNELDVLYSRDKNDSRIFTIEISWYADPSVNLQHFVVQKIHSPNIFVSLVQIKYCDSSSIARQLYDIVNVVQSLNDVNVLTPCPNFCVDKKHNPVNGENEDDVNKAEDDANTEEDDANKEEDDANKEEDANNEEEDANKEEEDANKAEEDENKEETKEDPEGNANEEEEDVATNEKDDKSEEAENEEDDQNPALGGNDDNWKNVPNSTKQKMFDLVEIMLVIEEGLNNTFVGAATVLNSTKSAPFNGKTVDITNLNGCLSLTAFRCSAPSGNYGRHLLSPFIVRKSPKVMFGLGAQIAQNTFYPFASNAYKYYTFNRTNISVVCKSTYWLTVKVFHEQSSTYIITVDNPPIVNNLYEAQIELGIAKDKYFTISCSGFLIANKTAAEDAEETRYIEIHSHQFEDYEDDNEGFSISKDGTNVSCLSTGNLLQRRRCRNPEECKSFPGDSEFWKAIPKLGAVEMSKQILSDYWGSWILCANHRMATIVRGLDTMLYDYIDDAPLGAKLRIFTKDDSLFLNSTQTFHCQGHLFLVSAPIRWYAKYANNLTVLLPDPINFNEEGEGVVQSSAEIRVQEYLTGIICTAYSWRTREVFTVSYELQGNVKYPVIPKLHGESDDTLEFIPGEEASLYCGVKDAEPPATMQWESQTENDTWISIESVTNYGTNSSLGSITVTTSVYRGSVVFQPFESDYAGKYRCVASNDFGEAQKVFHVSVKGFTVSSAAYVGVTLSVLLLISAVIGFRARQTVQDLKLKLYVTDEEIKEFRNGVVPGNGSAEYPRDPLSLPFNEQLEIPKFHIQVDEGRILGTGEFGMVFLATVEGLAGEVAVKTVKKGKSAVYFRSLLSEIKVMSFIGRHPNIVTFIGAYTQEIEMGILYVVTEYCSLSSLDKYLSSVQRPKLKNDDESYTSVSFKPDGSTKYVVFEYESNDENLALYPLLNWIRQIADAMSFIASKNVVHADLATRNVLLTSDMTAKLTDFGLSRKMYEYGQYAKKSKEPLPWRWLAPESLQYLKFSLKSDVWSFGMFMWEVFEFGGVPYPGLHWDVDFASRLIEGLRPPQPKFASSELYNIMMSCWEIVPSKRPDISQVKDAIDSHVQGFYTVLQNFEIPSTECSN